MVEILTEFIKALWFIFPMYAANSFPTLSGGKIPIDKKIILKDGQRLFGDGKTIEGFLFGMFGGMFVGTVEIFLFPIINNVSIKFGINMPIINFTVVFLLVLGSLIGDIGGSFIKRRLKMKRGADAPLLDQLDFVFGSLLFTFLFTQISVWMFLIIILITPFIHRIANIIAYFAKIKKVPW